MNNAYICASCRRRWLQQLPSIKHSNRSNFVSSANRQLEVDNIISHDTDTREASKQRSIPDVPRRPSTRNPIRRKRSSAIEDGFLERVFKGREPDKYMGLYSKSAKQNDVALRTNKSAILPRAKGGESVGLNTPDSSKRSGQNTIDRSLLDAHSQYAEADVSHGQNRWQSKDRATSADDSLHPTKSDPLLRVILDPMTSTSDSIEIWKIWYHDRPHNETDSLEKRVFRVLLEKTTKTWCQNPLSDHQPQPSSVLNNLHGNSGFELLPWCSTVWKVIRHVVESLTDTTKPNIKKRTNALLDEVVRLWDYHLHRYGRCTLHDNDREQPVRSVDSWDMLCRSEEMARIKKGRISTYDDRINAFFEHSQRGTTFTIDSLGLATYVVLRHYHVETISATSQLPAHSSFLKFLAQLLPYSNVRETLNRHIRNINSHMFSDAAKTFTITELNKAIGNAAAIATARIQTDVQQGRLNQQDVMAEVFVARIGRVVNLGDVRKLESLWEEVETHFASSADATSTSGIPRRIYCHFLTAYMGLNRPGRAIDIWNFMIQNRVTPTIAEWDAMLRGCRLAKDTATSEKIWRKMIEAGIKPDVQVWSSRIYTLTRTGQWFAAIQSFEQMVQDWTVEALKSDEYKRGGDLATIGNVGDVPKPNTYTLNGLIQGLARGRKYSHMAKVLQQGKQLGIKPDSYTFNPIIRSALKDGNPELALKLLLQMRDLNIKPDIATFTMILRSIYSNDFRPQTDTVDPIIAQQSTVYALLEEMHNSGIHANSYTFSTIISGLLEQGDKSDVSTMTSAQALNAAESILEYMASHKIQPSINIYTSLISFHFRVAQSNASSPDLAAIDALWQRGRGTFGSSPSSSLSEGSVHPDAVFFDRLIEGFARSGEIGRMMTALAQAGKRGKAPSWLAMTEVIRVLTSANDWSRAREIVANIRAEEASAVEGQYEVRLRTGKRAFWDLVEASGLGAELESTSSPTSFSSGETGAISHE